MSVILNEVESRVVNELLIHIWSGRTPNRHSESLGSRRQVAAVAVSLVARRFDAIFDLFPTFVWVDSVSRQILPFPLTFGRIDTSADPLELSHHLSFAVGRSLLYWKHSRMATGVLADSFASGTDSAANRQYPWWAAVVRVDLISAYISLRHDEIKDVPEIGAVIQIT
ncbi:hypothetical protein B0H17DRAFT_1173860 [Mycena rosella]|uniref:Uncharacterized protein n=1 Tax=Mycena rosella TaxID=1033263 RepID=A0AAD7H1G4_MYCRO|nr:hypothetical protein B0H17DRAFT_1173860 [Mycena rosella]